MLLWELLSALIERVLAESDDAGARTARSQRVRTLLPLLHNAALIVMIVMVTLVALSEIGIDIAPLLAGAGVIGLAIGFGAQTLVKDVITGLFILIEDAISVGDVVEVGGRTGVVESVTVRSIRLRDADGSVHTVPFSSVSNVRNMTKGFSYYVLDLMLDYDVDIDHATAVLCRIDEALRADEAWRTAIIDPIDVMGVDKLTDSSIVLRCRTKTVPGRQWAVGREFNRRIKDAFAAEGIVMPTWQRAVQVRADQAAKPPPAAEPPDAEPKPDAAPPLPLAAPRSA